MTLPNQVSPPSFALSAAAPSRVRGADTIAVAVLRGAGEPELGPGAAELSEDTGIDLLEVLRSSGAGGEVGEVGEVTACPVAGDNTLGASLLLLVGVGEASTGEIRGAGAALARRTTDHEVVATSVAAVGGPQTQAAFVEGMVLGSFSFDMRRDGARRRPVARVVLALSDEGSQEAAALARALAVAVASWQARALACVPSNVKSPQWLAGEIVSMGRSAGCTTEVLEVPAMQALGLGGVLGVGRGAEQPPRFVTVGYRPARGARKAPHVVLVGKGITFDSGGLSIKPGEAMSTMKRDMTGAGVVAAVLAALPAVACPVRVTGLMPLAENAFDGDAMRPGDVIRHYGGRTSEVRNTDAEGRLVLADALAYAVDKLDPDVLVDVATLTGAIKVALGTRTGGLFATDDALAGQLLGSGERAGESLWRMPLAEIYESKLTSKVADADNAAGGPGAITAALFLKPFTGGLPWAHLDIASVGDAPEDDLEWTRGPTGFGARLLLDWLGGPAPMAGVGA